MQNQAIWTQPIPLAREALKRKTRRVGLAMTSVLEAVAELREALEDHPFYRSKQLSVDAAMDPIDDGISEGWEHILP